MRKRYTINLPSTFEVAKGIRKSMPKPSKIIEPKRSKVYNRKNQKKRVDTDDFGC